MKSFIKPPTLVEVVMNSVLCLFGQKENWDEGKKLLGQMNFKEELIKFSETIETKQERVFTKFRNTYLKNPKYCKEDIEKTS